jgi:hypothetical protein
VTASLLNDGRLPSHRHSQDDRSLVIKQRERSQNSQLANFPPELRGDGTSARVPRSRTPVEAKSPPRGKRTEVRSFIVTAACTAQHRHSKRTRVSIGPHGDCKANLSPCDVMGLQD